MDRHAPFAIVIFEHQRIVSADPGTSVGLRLHDSSTLLRYNALCPHGHLEPNGTRVCVSADWRAASRISVTMRLLSSDERAFGFIWRRATAIRCEIASRSSAGRTSGVTSCSGSLANATRRPLPPVVATADPRSPYTSKSLRLNGQFHDAWMMPCAVGYSRRIVASSSTSGYTAGWSCWLTAVTATGR